MSTVFAVDTSGRTAGVCVRQNGDILFCETLDDGLRHSVTLLPLVRKAFDVCGLSVHDVDVFAVTAGPGSFTGLRVGLAAARALALAWGSELLGYPSLALVAAMARAQRGAQPVTVCMTGGHGEWFVAGYDAAGREVVPLVSLTPAAAAALDPAPLVAGSQAEALVARGGRGTAMALLPDARCLPQLPAHELRGDYRLIYGRAPDARLPEARP